MALDYVATSQKLVELVGGASNIASATHCMTRLRLVLKDESKANDEAVKKIKGVKSVIKQGGQYQIVIGNEVSNLFKEFQKLGNWGEESAAEPAQKKDFSIQAFFGFVSGCMTPLLPGLLGCGMVKVVLTLLTNFAGLDTSTSTYIILYAMGDCFLLFLPIFLCYTTAKKMGGNPLLWMIVGAAMVYPNLVTLMSGGSLELGSFLGMNATSFFGIPVICATYTSSVLPVMLMAPVMKVVERFADWVSPNVLKSFLKPMLFVLINVPVALIVLGPLGYVVGNILSGAVAALYTACPWLTVCVLSALMPFIVMTGMHYALVPLYLNNLATLGYDVIVKVTMVCSNIAQGGAAFGVAARTKDTETRSEGIACGISATIAGVTEPAMYGINLRYVKPMIGAVIGAGVSGLFCGLTNVRGYTPGGSPSFLSLVTFIGPDDPVHSVMFGAIGGVMSLVISFVVSFILFRDPKPEAEAADTPTAAPEAEEAPKPLVNKITLSSPMTGELVALESVPDAVFSSGALGEGAAIIPTVGKVVAPCDGTISATMDTKHAIGISAPDGMELLIHVGLNTVELNGKFYEYKVAEGDKVKKGDVLIEFDIDGIKAAGYPLYTPVLVTNAEDYVSVKVAEQASIQAGDELISVV